MLFVEPQFFIFFVLVFIIYWRLQSNSARKALLLIASYVFYGFWDWRFLALIALSSTIDYIAAIYIYRMNQETTRKLWLTLSIISNLGILGIFKYLNFFRDSMAGLFTAFGQPTSFVTLDIVLPVGISFFTFQSMSYTIDIYRRRIEPESNPINFYLYVAFFPQLVAGPIVRARTFLPQLQALRKLPMKRFHMFALMFAIGFFKKVAVSDNIAGLIDPVFAAPQRYDAAALTMSAFLYATQIYCDFSGYTDMAIAVAGFLGFYLPRNFSAPYFAGSITDFWRRWHISLSTWLRDYLYISLGGNRCGRWKLYRNLMITMGLGGLWHGASWNFVIWGILHGVALSAERFFRGIFSAVSINTLSNAVIPNFIYGAGGILKSVIKSIVTFAFVCLCWIFFRTVGFDQALLIVNSIFTWTSPGKQALPEWIYGAAILFFVVHFVFWRWDLARRVLLVPQFASAVLVGFVFALALMLLPQDTVPFIYFQF
jgi:D-alanyl-lipoteichoic acid acyltransferase DltB (MBOAT superfamily)